MDMPVPMAVPVRMFMLFTSVFMFMRMFRLMPVPAMIVSFHSLHLTSLAVRPG
jgi:hypothetical protein